ncbi:hypothetical protein ZIOFF_035780 [Zingiber officinale]|uniref:SPX domain-containing protein n=1 Tax=Zingiber officinale TaxID=94328 RepID=A0A8J5GCC9_ZINOF|nr:hypothetical protein ZIOFF_035780 [Zingiber officinale]
MRKSIALAPSVHRRLRLFSTDHWSPSGDFSSPRVADPALVDLRLRGFTATITSRALRERYQIWLEGKSVRPKNICRLLNCQPQLPHRALTEKHPDASSADGEDDPLHFSVTLQQEFCAMVRQIFIYTKEEVQKMDSSLVKILKKYDKRTGALIRQPFIEKVLQQPFFTTDLLYKLVKECVAMLDHLFPSNNLYRMRRTKWSAKAGTIRWEGSGVGGD